MNTIETTIKSLLDHKPFYAHFFLQCRIIYDMPGVPTAAASMTQSGPILIFNREFLKDQPISKVEGVIEHEILHIMFEHTSHMKRKELNPKIRNIAMDCSINQYIQDLPDGCIRLDELNKQLKLKLAPEETWEYYHYKLMEKAEELKSQQDFDVHGVDTGEGDEKDGNGKAGKEISAETLIGIIDKAVTDSAGNLPSVVQKIWGTMRRDSVIPWKQVLANFISSAISNSTLATRKRPNRRFGLDQPGRKKKRELTLGVCVDSSGSISDEQFQMFLNEITRITPNCRTTYVIDADCQVNGVQTLDKYKKLKWERKGCGGTAYQPAIDECVKLRCDAVVYFGDMDSADEPKNPGVPFLWIVTGEQQPPGKFGKVVRLK